MKVMLADTSAIVRAIFTQNLSNLPDYRVWLYLSSTGRVIVNPDAPIGIRRAFRLE